MKTYAKNVEEAISALTERPMLAADAERITIAHSLLNEEPSLPQPVRFARAVAALLDGVSVPIESHDLIAGRSVQRELTDDEEMMLSELISDPRSPYKTSVLSAGHCSYDWDMIAENGMPGLIAKAKASLSSKSDPESRIFLSSVIEVYDAIVRYILRYSEAARERGMTELSLTLKKAALEKPSDFRTALQLMWIITLINCSYITANPTLTVGRLDRILYPFYKEDTESGRLTRDEAKELITDYYCKHNLNMGRGEHQIGDASNSTTFARVFNFDAPQYLLLGGTDIGGRYAVNELTYLFAECIKPEFKNPVVVFYYSPGMDKEYPELWRILSSRALSSSALMFYNDSCVKSAYRRLGLPEEDFADYHHFGCNWPSPGSHSFWINGAPSARHYNVYVSDGKRADPYSFARIPQKGWQDVLIDILHKYRDRTDVTIEDIYLDYFDFMNSFCEKKIERGVREVRIRRRRPSSVCFFCDCFTRAPIERGECFTACAKYVFALLNFQMFGTVCDCFTVIDALVFRDKRLTLGELLDAVDSDFEGHEITLALCRSVPKYGSNDAFSNMHVKRLAEEMANIARKCSKKYMESDGFIGVPCLQSDTWHIKYGRKYGATPDGRRAGMPFTQNSRPANGSCTSGITGMLNSMLNIPSDGFVSGALNLDVDPKQFQKEDGIDVFASILAVYFNRGGLHAQVTSVSREELLDAQINPQLHRDLRVRITGYSGIFVDISRPLQNDIIERMK